MRVSCKKFDYVGSVWVRGVNESSELYTSLKETELILGVVIGFYEYFRGLKTDAFEVL